MAVDVVPEGELGEAEIADDAGLADVPAVHDEDCPANGREHSADVCSVLVRGEGINSRHLDPDILPDQLQEGGIEPRLLVAHAERVALVCRFSHDLYGDKDERRVNGRRRGGSREVLRKFPVLRCQSHLMEIRGGTGMSRIRAG